jgi:hypothetical protein
MDTSSTEKYSNLESYQQHRMTPAAIVRYQQYWVWIPAPLDEQQPHWMISQALDVCQQHGLFTSNNT